MHQVYSGHADAIYCLIANRDNSLLYSGSGDSFIGQWNTLSGAFEEPVAKMPATIYSLALHPKEDTLYSGLINGVLFSLDLSTKTIIKSLQLGQSGLFSLALSHDGHHVCIASGDGLIYVLDHDSQELIQSLKLTDKAIRTIEFSPCGQFVIAGSSDHQLYFLEFDGELKLRQVLKAHDNSVFTAIYKEGFALLTGGRDAMLKQWLWNDGVQAWKGDQSIAAHNFTVNKIAISPDKHFVATSSRDKTIKIWGFKSLDLLKVINLEKYPGSHTHSVNTIMWLDKHTLISAGDDRRMISWKIGD